MFGYVLDLNALNVVIAVIAALISVLSAYAAFKIQSKNRAEDFHISWNQGVVAWANLCIDATSRMHVLIDSAAEVSSSEIWELRSSLTSLIDQGRLLFENDKNTEYGANKPAAYRGYRPVLMDNLVRAYDNFLYFLDLNVEELTAEKRKNVSYVIILEQKEFVSEIQMLIDPSWFQNKAKNFKKEEI